MSDKLQRAKSYWESERRRDMEGILGHFAENAEFVSPTMRLHGRKEIRKYYEGIMQSFEEVVVEPRNAVEQGDDLAVEWYCRLTGSDGKVRLVDGCNVFTIRDGLFERMRVYFNPADFE